MEFNSLSFLVFFPIVTLIYFIIPKKIRYIWLLIASYFFYMNWNPKYGLLLLGITLASYVAGLLIAKAPRKGTKKLVLGLCFVVSLGLLVVFKYFDFLLHNLNAVLWRAGLNVINNPFDIVLPVGISFFTFQSLGYTVDVYRGTVQVEKNPLKFALFVSFFPQLVAGPIERSGNLLKQINETILNVKADYKRIVKGLMLMLWGLFLKMVIADRAAILANTVFDNYFMYESTGLILGALAFGIQIYCDFSAYSAIAIGAAEVMGFTLMENFDTPYFSRSIREFWQRWHISLSTWFRDYLYIPLGGNRKGKFRKYLNIMITFLVSGLWHGANWTFVIWGGLHGAYQVIGEVTRPLKDKIGDRLKVNREAFSYKLGQGLITFILVDIAWIFFRADSLQDALIYIKRMVFRLDLWTLTGDGIYSFGLGIVEMRVLCIALLALLVVSIIKYVGKKRMDEFLFTQNMWFKWVVSIILIFAVIVYGIYGQAFDASAFIYFQF